MAFVSDAVILGRVVHHKEHLNSSNIHDPELTISFDNLELLCQDCHNKEHFEKNDFNDDGELKDDGKSAFELVGIFKK